MSAHIRVAVEAPVDDDVLAAATARAHEAAVMEFYRLGSITSGRAAAELGIERAAFLSLAASKGIATVQVSAAELREEVDALGR